MTRCAWCGDDVQAIPLPWAVLCEQCVRTVPTLIKERNMTYDDGYQMITRFFTFGAEHTLPDGMYAGDKTVMVEAPEDVDHRALFMAWLGSNKFSSEYNEQEYRDSRLGMTNTIAFSITAEPVCWQCEWPDSQCKCLPDDPWEGEDPDYLRDLRQDLERE